MAACEEGSGDKARVQVGQGLGAGAGDHNELLDKAKDVSQW